METDVLACVTESVNGAGLGTYTLTHTHTHTCVEPSFSFPGELLRPVEGTGRDYRKFQVKVIPAQPSRG